MQICAITVKSSFSPGLNGGGLFFSFFFPSFGESLLGDPFASMSTETMKQRMTMKQG